MTSIPNPSAPPVPPGTSFQFNGVVRLTRIGTGYLLFTLVIGFAALNTGNNALYIGLTFMLGSLLLSGIASKGGLKHLDVELGSVDEVWAGQTAHGMLRVVNRSPIWNVRDVVVTSDELASPLFIPMLVRHTTIDVPATLLFARRGRVALKRLDFYTRYPFGFFLKKRRIRIDGEVIVYPRLLGGQASQERFRAVIGDDAAANRPGPGTEIHSFREYARGDSLRQVYWKKSASLGRWIVKQTDAEAAQAVHVVIDPFKPHAASEEQFEQMVSEAATFIRHSLQRGLEVVVTLPRITLRARESEGAVGIFRELALLEPMHEEVAQAAERGAVLFAIRRDDESQSA